MNQIRTWIAACVVSAGGIIALCVNEGYIGTTYYDDAKVATIGFGRTSGVKPGQKTDPITELKLLDADVQKRWAEMKKCINDDVKLTQNETDAYFSFGYNVGTAAFCKSTLVKKLNEHKYDEACKELLNWIYITDPKTKKKVKLKGLVNRRTKEYNYCIGKSDKLY